MRIHDVIKSTGLKKRTIHFYIDEKLISPEVNMKNGYFEFSDEDVNHLKLISQLRKADFSISDIRTMIQYPGTLHFYLQTKTEELNRELDLMKLKIEAIENLEKGLPIIVTYEDMLKKVVDAKFPDKGETDYKNTIDHDAVFVSYYLWGTFLQGIAMTEYRQYLWEKALKAMKSCDEKSIRDLRKYLDLLPGNELDREFERRYAYIKEITDLSPSDYGDYVDHMKEKLIMALNDVRYIEKWCSSYYEYTLPSTSLFDSEVNILIGELSPAFSLFHTNIHACCDMFYQWLHSREGEPTRLKLYKKLEGHIDLDVNHHGMLAAIVSF